MVDPIAQLLARQEIHDVLMRYARGIDRRDFATVADCYHPGATDDHGAFKGTIEDFIPWVQTSLERFASTMHFLGNVLIEFDAASDHVAWVESYCVAYHRLHERDTDSIAGLRYVDRFERQNDHWRIADRKIVVEWNRLDEVTSLGFSPEYLRGAPHPDDPVYDR